MRLPLGRTSSAGPDDFIQSPSNAEAFAAVRNWAAWPGGALALVGPAGSGKSHLADRWAEESAAVRIGPDQPITAFTSPAVLVEDADRRAFRGEGLFHLLNAADAGARVLLTAREPPTSWAVAVPDLRSRVNALRVAELHEPDDALLTAVMIRFFRERNIRVENDVLTYLVWRIERSIPEALAVVEAIDEAAAAAGREITRALARHVLDALRAGPDLFDQPCPQPSRPAQQTMAPKPEEPST